MRQAASHGRAISSANRPNATLLAVNASRLVRFETGSSSDPEFARCVQAYTWGLARTPSRVAVANTTGVSSTTVASSDSTAVTAARDSENLRQQTARPASRPARHPFPAGTEQAVGRTQLRQHQHCREKPDDRPELARLSDRRTGRDGPGHDDQYRGRDRRHSFRPVTRPDHRPCQYDSQRAH